jgi:hypothetical protein
MFRTLGAIAMAAVVVTPAAVAASGGACPERAGRRICDGLPARSYWIESARAFCAAAVSAACMARWIPRAPGSRDAPSTLSRWRVVRVSRAVAGARSAFAHATSTTHSIIAA